MRSYWHEGTQSALYRLPVADVHCMYVEVSRAGNHIWLVLLCVQAMSQAPCDLLHGSGYTVKLYFSHILVTSVAFLLCAWHVKFKECLQFEQYVVEKLLFVKLVSPFRKPINHISVMFVVSVISHTSPWRVPWLHGCGRNARKNAECSQIGLVE